MPGSTASALARDARRRARARRDAAQLVAPPRATTSSKCGARLHRRGLAAQVAEDQRRAARARRRPRAPGRGAGPRRRSRCARPPSSAASRDRAPCACRSRAARAKRLASASISGHDARDLDSAPATARAPGPRRLAADVEHVARRRAAAPRRGRPQRARSSWASPRTKRPPSENESGVAFSTPDDRHAVAREDRRRAARAS